MATTGTKLMTAEELLAMPDDGYRYELIRGEIDKDGTCVTSTWQAGKPYG